LVVSQLNKPAAKPSVHFFGADDRLGGYRPVVRQHRERKSLAATHPSVRANQLLECRHFIGRRIVGSVDHDVGDILE